MTETRSKCVNNLLRHVAEVRVVLGRTSATGRAWCGEAGNTPRVSWDTVTVRARGWHAKG